MMKPILSRLFPADMWHGRLSVLVVAAFLKLILFDVVWCTGTTFRAMSDIGLYLNALLGALLLVLPYMVSRRFWIAVTVLFLADGVLVANLMYCRTYFTAIPLDSYLLAGNLSDFTASVVDSMRWLDILIPLTTVAAWIIGRRMPRRFPPRSTLRYLVCLAMAALLAAIAAMCRGGFRAHYSRLQESCYYTTCTTPIYTVGGSVMYDILSGNSRALDEAGRARIDSWMEQKEKYRPHRALTDSIAVRDNLVIILCESLESWVIDRKVDGVEITPVLDSLIADTASTLYAPNVLTQVAAGRSIDCQLLVNAGMLPMQSSVYSMRYPQNRYYTLNRALAEKNGARSYILTCDKPIVWNQEPIARAFGIDTLLTRSSWRNDELVGNPAKLSDGSFMHQAVEKMQAGEIWPVGENAFLQFVTYSGHNPFRLPENLRTVTFSDRFPERMRDYMMMAHYTDSAIGTLLSYLRSRPDYDRTLIVITGDHEGLAMDRAAILDNPDAREIVSPGQYTPLIVVNSPVGGRYDAVLGQADIYPTLLNLMQLDSYRWKGMGNSILDPSKAPFAISSMTGELAGDTTAVSPEALSNIRSARAISDLIISTDAFAIMP
ncbi:LTA synthase family protein [Muribaculum intestinale]|uniref:LTA synthase family protein n=1 Tax=Muribaculum intestinale TaxID=1796646 RepID=UPI0025A9F886|nr:LTA synthase family protein [Muribaculum intestinale]